MFLTFAIYSSEVVSDANIEYIYHCWFQSLSVLRWTWQFIFWLIFSGSYQTQENLFAFVSLVLYYVFFLWNSTNCRPMHF